MYIKVQSPEKNLTLRLPTPILINSLTAAAASRHLSKNGLQIPAEILREAFRIVKKYKKRHPDWLFIEVQSANGEYVQIKF